MSDNLRVELNKPKMQEKIAASAAPQVKSEEKSLSAQNPIEMAKNDGASSDISISAIKTPIESTNEKLLEYGINLEKPLVITPELKEKIQKKGKKGFWENLKSGLKNMIPFGSTIYESYKSYKLLSIVKKMEKSSFASLSKEEREQLILFQLEKAEDELRGSTFMGKVATTLSYLPAFAGEFALTGGLYRIGASASKYALSKSLQVAARKVAREGLKHASGKAVAAYATKKATEVVFGSAARSFGLSHRALNNYLQRRVVSDFDENGNAITSVNKENAMLTAGKAVADNYIETLSEQSGALFGFTISKPLSKIPFLGKLLHPNSAAQKFMAKTGFHGVGEEFFEERFGGFLRGLINLDTDKNKSYLENLYHSTVPTLEQAGVEVTTSLIWGGAMTAAHSTKNAAGSGLRKIKAFKETEKIEKINDKTISQTEARNKIDRQILDILEKSAKVEEVGGTLKREDIVKILNQHLKTRELAGRNTITYTPFAGNAFFSMLEDTYTEYLKNNPKLLNKLLNKSEKTEDAFRKLAVFAYVVIPLAENARKDKISEQEAEKVINAINALDAKHLAYLSENIDYLYNHFSRGMDCYEYLESVSKLNTEDLAILPEIKKGDEQKYIKNAGLFKESWSYLTSYRKNNSAGIKLHVYVGLLKFTKEHPEYKEMFDKLVESGLTLEALPPADENKLTYYPDIKNPALAKAKQMFDTGKLSFPKDLETIWKYSKNEKWLNNAVELCEIFKEHKNANANQFLHYAGNYSSLEGLRKIVALDKFKVFDYTELSRFDFEYIDSVTEFLSDKKNAKFLELINSTKDGYKLIPPKKTIQNPQLLEFYLNWTFEKLVQNPDLPIEYFRHFACFSEEDDVEYVKLQAEFYESILKIDKNHSIKLGNMPAIFAKYHNALSPENIPLKLKMAEKLFNESMDIDILLEFVGRVNDQESFDYINSFLMKFQKIDPNRRYKGHDIFHFFKQVPPENVDLKLNVLSKIFEIDKEQKIYTYIIDDILKEVTPQNVELILENIDIINKMNVSQSMKVKLFQTNYNNSVGNLIRINDYFSKIPAAVLAKCSDFTVIQMMKVLSLEIKDLKTIKQKLVTKHLLSELSANMSPIEAEAFAETISSLEAQIAEKLAKVISVENSEDVRSAVVELAKEFLLRDNMDDSVRLADFGQYGKNGVKLSYSRGDFVNELNKLISVLPEEQQKAILEKIEIEFVGQNIAPANVRTIKNTDPMGVELSAEELSAEKKALRKFEEDASSRATEIREESITFGGKSVRFEIFDGSKTGGSSPGYYAKNLETGELFYIKYPQASDEQVAQEILASDLYRLAGLASAQIEEIVDAKGKKALASKVIPSLSLLDDSEKGQQYSLGFAADAWLANWDAVQNNNSLYSDTRKTPVRLDVGGSLEYRARGGLKEDFGLKVNELLSFFENGRDAQYSGAYAKMTLDNLKQSLRQVVSISNKDIRRAVAQRGVDADLAETLIKRKDYLSQVLAYLETQEQGQRPIKDLIAEAVQVANRQISSSSQYDGVVTARNLDENISAEKALKDLIEKFYATEANTGNVKTDKFINELISAFPEFINIIGKKQHGTHDYSVDIHTLKVLQSALQNPLYQELSAVDKLILKFSILFHDMAKAEGRRDPGHKDVSAYYVRDLLAKINLPADVKDRIIGIVKNHHWFGDFNQGKINAEDVAIMFRRPEDMKIATIMAAADLTNINDKFHKGKIEALAPAVAQIQEKLTYMYQTGVFTFTTNVIKKDMISPNADGVRVVEFANIPANFDMRKLGFDETSKNNMSFTVHCTKNPEDLFVLADANSNSDICVSNVSLAHKHLYNENSPFGIVLRATNQNNILNSWWRNQGTGGTKGLDNMRKEVFKRTKERTFRRDNFLAKLKELSGFEMTVEEYGVWFRMISQKQFKSHIQDYVLNNGKTFKRDDILAAMRFVDNEIRTLATNNESSREHNETNVSIPKPAALFAKVNTYAELVEAAKNNAAAANLLKAAKKYDIPVLLIGR